MTKLFKEISYPEDLEYASDASYLPLQFYLDVLPSSQQIYLKLGYFSSSAIKTLAYGFAQFIMNGGRIKIICNHYMYNQDKELLQKDISLQDAEKKEYLLSDLGWISNELNSSARHFFNCLKLLVSLDRLELIPVIQKPSMMMHYKQGVFIDSAGDSLSMEGSCNFTASGLLENAESISVSRSWAGGVEETRVEKKRINIQNIVDRKSDLHDYLNPTDILDAFVEIGKDKSITELLKDERDLISENMPPGNREILERYAQTIESQIKSLQNEPAFPYLRPRDYQDEAYEEWIKAGKKGIFAMATGTGKTLTALNCLLQEYKEYGSYQAVILVPTLPLLEQWYKEVRAFNFASVYRVSSTHTYENSIDLLNTQLAFDSSASFIVICTYPTFSKPHFQKRISNFPNTTLLIADEAHRIGAQEVRTLLPQVDFEKRIALSATPTRRFDPEGNKVIEDFFNSSAPYTYSFSMERAINERILCAYSYHPHIVYLNEEEMKHYVEVSKKIAQLYDHTSSVFRYPTVAKKLMQERTKIIDKAKGKFRVFKEIIRSTIKDRGNLDYSFIYVPEGVDSEGVNFLDQYLSFMQAEYPSIMAHHYTSQSDNRSQIMQEFENATIKCLLAMKCLDEGVDIPRAEIAIFCSSTGNPMQFIQRRGRVLRQHKDKSHAIIHDLIVLPISSREEGTLKAEQKIIKDELTRVIHFSRLAQNYFDCMDKFVDIAKLYELNIYSLQSDLESVDYE